MAVIDNILAGLQQDLATMAAQDGAAAIQTQKLQKAANEFINAYKIFNVKRQQVQSIVNHMSAIKNSFGESGLSKSAIDQKLKQHSEYVNYKNSKKSIIEEYFRPFYQSMHVFHDALNEALGQSIIYTFLIWSPKTHEMIGFELEDPLLLIDDIDMRSSGQINARFVGSMNKIKKAIQQYGTAIRQSSFARDDKKQIDVTYEAIQERWKYATKIGTHRVMWKPKDRWNVYKVSSGGDFDQAYGAIIFTRKGQATDFRVSALQIAVDLFMEFVKQVDSASGMLQGDYSGDGGVEYAAKGVGASFMGFDQFIKVATALSKGSLNATLLRKLKDYFAEDGMKKMHAVRDQAAEAADEAVYQSMQELIDDQHNRYAEFFWG